MVLAWKSWKVWAGTPDPVGPVCLDPPPPPPRFAPPPDTRPGLAPPSLQKEEEEAVELLVEEPTLSIGMTVFYYRQGLKIMLWQWMERLWWRCGAGVRTLKLVSLYLPQVEHRCRHVHNIMGLKIQVINNNIRNVWCYTSDVCWFYDFTFCIILCFWWRWIGLFERKLCLQLKLDYQRNSWFLPWQDSRCPITYPVNFKTHWI